MRNGRLVRITRYAGVLGAGVLAGVATTVLVLELALRRVDGPEYVVVRQAEFGLFTAFIGAVFVPTFVAVVLLVGQTYRAHSPAFRPAVIALALLVLALGITLVVNGPINVDQLSWNSQTPPANWAEVRDHWQIAHGIRTVAIVLAFGFVAAATLDRPTGTS
jgi:uncharacterized membrane protein